MNHKLIAAKTILRKLNQLNFQVYLAGGAVRDILLNRPIDDIDIVTNAKPDEIARLFEITRDVGKKFGVVVVVVERVEFHVATFRGDQRSSDHRHPDGIFWADARQDARRRDLTINGLFATLKCIDDVIAKKQCTDSEIIDFANGRQDLAGKIIRFIGDADQRIEEDVLRILRAIRFKNILQFDYEIDTKQAIANHASQITEISAERIRDEFNKMFIHPSRADSLKDLDELGILKYILPEVDRLHGIDQSWKFHGEGDLFTHTLLAIKALPPEAPLLVAWGTLLHDIGKPDTKAMVPDKKYGGERVGFYDHHRVGAKIAQKIMERLHFSTKETNHIVWLVENHMMVHEILEMREGRQKRWLLDPRLPDLLELHRADASGKGEGRRVDLTAYERVKKLREEELAKPPPPPKLVDGHDIMKEFYLEPGPEVGRLLKLVEEAVWDGKVATKENAFDLVRSQKK